MKLKALITILFLSIQFYCQAQDKASLEKRAQEMYDYAVQGNYKKVVDYFYPKNFENMPKEQIIASLENKGPGAPVIVNVPPDFKFGEIKKIGDAYYCVFYHNYQMRFALNEKVDESNADLVVNLYKQNIGAEDASFDAATKSVITKQRVQVIAIADKYSNNLWTFGVMPDDTIKKQLGL